MVVACVALIVALSGTSYAALNLPRNSVGNKQLRPNAVTSGKVRNGTLTAKDFKSSALRRGPRGPQGPAAPGGIPRVALASRDPFAPGGTAAPLPVGATPVDVVGLSVAAGSNSYVSSSGPIVANGPSRLIANGQAVILNAAAAAANVTCRIVLVSASEVKAIGGSVNALLQGNGDYVPVAVSSGVDLAQGTYDVRVQCVSEQPSMQFHRGNLTVSVAGR